MNTEQSSVCAVEEMERLNVAQKAYYEALGGDTRQVRNFVTRSWVSVRNRVAQYRTAIGVKETMRSLHYEWFGDLSDCDVMELGCACGNSVSLHLARQARSYLGVDLNSVGVEQLKRKLADSQLRGTAAAIDFLSKDFPYGPFDVVYAQGVLHHFRHFETFLEILHSRLSPGGRVVAFDPMETAILPRWVRAAYRPFQSDADWEWPFNRASFKTIDKYFEVQKLQGMMGWSKWGIVFLPLGIPLAAKLGRRLHALDMKHANRLSPALWRCMNVATLLVRR